MSNQISTALSVATISSGAERVRVAPEQAQAARTRTKVSVESQVPVPDTTKPEAGGKEVPAEQPSFAELVDAAKLLNNAASALNRDLQFSVDDDSGRTVITVLNSDTGEVVRQIPGEEVLRVARSVESGQVQLIDGQA